MATSRKPNWLSRKFFRRQKTTRRKVPHGCQLGFEPLEDRRMLSLSVPAYSSYPGAAQTLYLDFDGNAPFSWTPDIGNTYQVSGPHLVFPTPVPAFSTDGDVNNFSDAELLDIVGIWLRVSEKFSPFAINVTTVNPGVVMDSQNMTVQIGGSNNDWYNGLESVFPFVPSFGAADRDGFVDGGENTAFVFSADAVANGLTGQRLDQFVSESAAQMAATMVGLKRQRIFGNEFNPGVSTIAPIMGGSNNNTTARGIWWDTNLAGGVSPDPHQDDLAELTAFGNRLQYRGKSLDVPTLSFGTLGLAGAEGVIRTTGDADAYFFQATATRATVNVVNALGGMLAPTASIRISGTNTFIPVNRTQSNTSTSIEATNLVPGTNYVLIIGSQGGYGDIGQYTLIASMQSFAKYDSASHTVVVGGFAGNNNITLSRDTINNTVVVTDSVNGGPVATQEFSLPLVNSISVNLGSGDDVVSNLGAASRRRHDNPRRRADGRRLRHAPRGELLWKHSDVRFAELHDQLGRPGTNPLRDDELRRRTPGSRRR